MHQLNPVMEKFYLGILEYAGLEIRDDEITNKNEKVGDFRVDGKGIALPYLNLLKDPKGRMFFHLLNENYSSPENAVFNLFKDRLVLELNLRLSSLITSLVALAAEPQLQKKVTSGALIKLISDIGEADMPVIEEYLRMTQISKKQNHEGFNFDVFLKKNGEVRGTPFAAIGKINFRLYDEIRKALDSSEKGYKLYGTTVKRKKDLLVIASVFSAIFPNIDEKDFYIEGTDNKIFRYLNALLKVTYLISKRMNEIGALLLELNEPALAAEDIISPLDWVDQLETLYGMATEIRLIPGQTDIAVEAKRMKLDESRAAQVQQQVPQPESQPAGQFNPMMVQQPAQQPIQQPIAAQQTAQRPLTPEEIVRGSLGMGIQQQPMMTMPGMQPVMSGMGVPMVINPMLQQQPMLQPQISTPAWMQMEMLKEQQRQMQQQNPQLQQLQQQQLNPMLQQQLLQQQLMQLQQQQLLQQAQQQQQFNPMLQQPGQIPINPLFAGPARAPFN